MKLFKITLFAVFALIFVGCESSTNNEIEIGENFEYVDSIGCYKHVDFDGMRLAYPVIKIIGNDTKELRFYSQTSDVLTLCIYFEGVLSDSLYIDPNWETSFPDLWIYHTEGFTFKFKTIRHFDPYDELSNEAFRETLKFAD